MKKTIKLEPKELELLFEILQSAIYDLAEWPEDHATERLVRIAKLRQKIAEQGLKSRKS